MSTKFARLVVLLCFLCTLHTNVAAAQTLDEVGGRASALGAFVAVADDSAAVLWNPAGLINGPFFNIALDFGQSTMKPGDGLLNASATAGRQTTSFLSAGVPPLGISYYRGRQTELSPVGPAPSGRQDREGVLRTLETTHVGVTVLQSLADGITVGATARLVRGSFASETLALGSWDEGFERAELLDATSRTTADVDAGALVSRGRFRVGIVARNLAAPTFAAGSASDRLERHVRIGTAWGEGWPGLSKTIIAVDADLTRVDHAGGERRDVAAGAERWFRNQTIAVRGGIRASTIGETRPLASFGGSYAVRSGIYVDVYAATGRAADRRWGIAGRLMY